KKALLSAIINEHIDNASAVGSRLLVDKYGFNVSPATIRNDMMELEEEGYLTHQFTSSGRIPTEKGWKWHLEHIAGKEIEHQDREFLQKSVESGYSGTADMRIKKLAKALAELSKETVIVAFTPDDIYYTGISHLFSQPEFRTFDVISRMSEIIDHLDEVVSRLFPEVNSSIIARIGSDNPFGSACSALFTQCKVNSTQNGMMAILGPMRMDYATHMSRLKCAQQVTETSFA
ncbi:MAG: DeoR family transcriptional regulator, partial [Patescibacteria group bacterium]